MSATGIALVVFGGLHVALIGLLAASFHRPGRWVLVAGIAGLAVAAASPPLGMALTVLGISSGHQDAARADPDQKAALLAGAIGQSMNATVAGFLGLCTLGAPATGLLVRGLVLRSRATAHSRAE